MDDVNAVFERLSQARGDHVSEADLLAAIKVSKVSHEALDRLATATVALRRRGVNLNYRLGVGWAIVR